MRFSRSLFPVLLLASCQQSDGGSEAGNKVGDEMLDQVMFGSKLASDDTWSNTGRLVCRPVVQHSCDGAKCSTQDEKMAVFIRWTPGTKTYERCGGSKPCDRYEGVTSYSGSWTNVGVPANGVSVRFTLGASVPGGTSLYTEAVTLNSTYLIYYGRCERDKGEQPS